MSALKYDESKPPSYLIAHDVVISDHSPSQGIEFYAQRLRNWWNRAGTLPALQVDNADYFGMVAVLACGAKKYGPRNWEPGRAYHRDFRAAMDHFARRGEVDEETGLPHRHHFLCCYMFLASYTARGLHEFDDRPGVGPYVRQKPEHEPEPVPAPEPRFHIVWNARVVEENGWLNNRSGVFGGLVFTKEGGEAEIAERVASGSCNPGDYMLEPV